MYTIGVDIGGTKIAAGLVDQGGHCGRIYTEWSIPDDRERMYHQVVKCIKQAIAEAGVPWSEIGGIGVGVPGKVDVIHGMALYQNNLSWTRFPLVQRLRDTFQTEVWMDNDVAMAAYGEWLLAKCNYDEITVYVTWSTGIACCTIYKGEIISGSGFAGELGLTLVTSNGKRLEELGGGRAIQQRGILELGRNLTTKEWVQQYEAGEAAVVNLLNDALKTLSKGIYAVICLLDPHKIILGGSVITNNHFLIEKIKTFLQEMTIPDQHESIHRLQISQANEKAAIIGAALKRKNASYEKK